MKTGAYRYPNEQAILTLTLLLVLGVIALTAAATLCTSVIFVLIFVAMSYFFSQSHHQELMQGARRVTEDGMPGMAQLVRQGVSRLQPGDIDVFVAPGRVLNAYTFGLSSPKTVVLYAPLFQVMDEDEMMFILGHELGHVALGHTWLNSLVGGLAGIPSSWGAGLILVFAFRWWNRTCEFSADRAGLLACGRLDRAVTALVKLVAGPEAGTSAGLAAAYQQIDAEDDTILGSLNEVLGTHPILIRRIDALRRYAGTAEYHRLQASVQRSAAG